MTTDPCPPSARQLLQTTNLSANAHCYFLLNELSTELFNSFSKIATCIIFLLELFYTPVCPRVEASSLLFLQQHSRPPPPSFGLHLLHTAAASSPAPLIILFSPSIFFPVFTRLIAFTFVELTPGALLGGFASFCPDDSQESAAPKWVGCLLCVSAVTPIAQWCQMIWTTVPPLC